MLITLDDPDDDDRKVAAVEEEMKFEKVANDFSVEVAKDISVVELLRNV